MSKNRSLEKEKKSVPEQLAAINFRLGKIERHMFWETVFASLRLFIIVVPVVIAFVVIPPFVKKYAPVVGAAFDKVGMVFQNLQNIGGARGAKQ